MEKSWIILVTAIMLFFLILNLKKVGRRQISKKNINQYDYPDNEIEDNDFDDDFDDEDYTEKKHGKSEEPKVYDEGAEYEASLEKSCQTCVSFKNFTCPGQKIACQFYRKSTQQDDLKNNIYHL